MYLSTVVLAFMVLVTHVSPHLSLLEIAAACVPVASVGGAWLFYLISLLLNFLGCETLTHAQSHCRVGAVVGVATVVR